jgi:pyruvate-formate lyase
MSNGNGPSNGADKKGITALLNSMSKFDAAKHMGVINNIRLTKGLFKKSMPQVKALLSAFYENGGSQTNLCVIDKNDLENAVREPEKYQNLIVRIGGFSARFVTLSPVVQRELIERTTYE